MELIELGCNTAGNIDGIGKHTRLVNAELNTRSGVHSVILSGSTENKSKLRKILSLEMSKALLHASTMVKKTQVDCVIVEYPFDEFNPLIILAYRFLHGECKKAHTVLALSMHEYDRVKYLRKKVIEHLIKSSDLIFVSEPKYLNKLKQLNSSIYLRTIPNHVPLNKNQDLMHLKNKNRYVYFGLVNKSKAFNEMITAWDLFNSDMQHELYILTATKIEFEEATHNAIHLFFNLNNERVAEIMQSSMFSIIPVKPDIGYNNSSMVSALQAGSVPIGVFNNDYRNKSFVINLKNYSIDSIVHGLNVASALSKEKANEMSNAAEVFGREFTLEKTVNMMLDAIKDAQ